MVEMAKGDWWFKFEITAWRTSPELRACSLETRGFWIDCIAIMKDTGKATITGTYKDFARGVGCFPDEAERCILELKRNKTADVTLRNDAVTVKSRKYARELKAKELTRLRVQKLRSNANVTPKKRLSVKSNKKEVIKAEEKNGNAAVAAKKPDPVETRIWTDGVDLLKQVGVSNDSARGFLGKQVKVYGRELVAQAIAITQAKNSPDPKAFIVSVLQDRLGAKNRAASSVGKYDEDAPPIEASSTCHLGHKFCLDTHREEIGV